MAIASFVFTSLSNSFKVHVQNLEKLSVTQIQEIESFVIKRKGVFDFTNYTFVIRKRLEFNEFEKLISLSKLEAKCIDKPLLQHSKPRVGFGQYKGMTYDELPDSYLLWLKTNYNGKDRTIIDKELKKRRL